MQYSPSGAANTLWASQVRLRILLNSNVRHRAQKIPPFVPIRSQTGTVHVLRLIFSRLKTCILNDLLICVYVIEMVRFLQIFLSKFPTYFSPLHVVCSRQLKPPDFVNRTTQDKTVLPFTIRCITLTCYITSVCIYDLPNCGALRKIFGPKRWQGNGENYIMRSLMMCTAHQILCGW